MAIDMEQFKVTYIEESLEGLDNMESHLLNLEPGSRDEDAINTIFRAAHSIKGGGATFGFSNISEFTHVVETLLDQIRNGEREVTQQAIDLFLESVDCVRDMLATAQGGGQSDASRSTELKAQLDALLVSDENFQPDAHPMPGDSQASPDEQSIASEWNIRFKPFPGMLATGNDVVRMFRELAELGELHTKVNFAELPALTDLGVEDCYLSWEATLKGQCTLEDIKEIFVWVEDECELVITAAPSLESSDSIDSKDRSTDDKPVSGINGASDHGVNVTTAAARPSSLPSENKSKPQNKTTAERRANAESSSIRVDIDKIDSLINMVGELVITQSMLSQLGEEFDIERLEKLRDGLGQLERNTRELQESVMRIRMIPISFAFNRFPRMIHDLCNKFGKKVQLKLSGESTELDKTVMEKIGDPLVHLVRNAMDHGIETPDKRAEAGKPETGTVHLNAFHQGGNIVIEITDDGAGINADKILKKAIQRGLVEEGIELSQARIHDLLFQPGFSTADEITDVSGRGVGMDVVRKNIQALGGTVDVQSTIGKGSKFTVRLPLTLAILDGQLVRVGDHTYIIPLVSIVESLQVHNKNVNAIAGKAELYKLRDEYIPIVRLYEAFHIEPDSRSLENGLLVVVEGDGQKAGLLVDDLLAQQQVVIKSLETNFRRVDGLSGATILGDGTVALILDVAGVIRVSQGRISHHDSINANGVAA
ncbi:MAG: chemotaxis protein CheA [Gammaproteobacteria bacterium]|jgi:two-component system chemotaxis sensor kinase CheA|nr:chemotaxis protein CheA [Gammaproteobacteria bacterium]